MVESIYATGCDPMVFARLQLMKEIAQDEGVEELKLARLDTLCYSIEMIKNGSAAEEGVNNVKERWMTLKPLLGDQEKVDRITERFFVKSTIAFLESLM